MPHDQQHQRKLKNFLLIPGFQLRLLGYFLALFVLTTASLYSASYIFFWRLNQKAINVGIPQGHVFFDFINNQKQDLDLFFIVLAVVNLVLLLGACIVISHRISGPLFKLKAHLMQISSDTEAFKLRDKDFFRDLEGPVNSLKDKLK